MPLFRGALAAGANYLDMAMSLSHPHPDEPYARTGVKLGDEQFAMAGEWEDAGQLALVGMGVEPGLSDVFARYAADTLFSSIDEVGVRDGANLVVDGLRLRAHLLDLDDDRGVPQPARSSGRRDRGWFTTEPFSELEVFDFPAGIGPVECVNVEHEEVLLVPRWVDAGAGHVQVRPRRGVHRRPQDPPQARPRLDRRRSRWTGSRCHHATSWPPACPTRPSSATTCTA